MAVDAQNISVGESRTLVLFEGLSRTQIVMYAGASGDYNPLHTDERYTTEVAGYPSVFAHGMLTMGATGRVVTDWFGPDRVQRFAARFVNQVWPGDALTATAVVDDVREADGRHVADLSVVTVNGNGDTVLTASATVLLDG